MAPPARSTNAARRRLTSRNKLPAARPMSMRSITPPIIRIVHVNAPRLICTDVTNFRTLVQEMTGNVQSKYIPSPCKQEEQNSCSTTKSNITHNSVYNELEASGETADYANILIRATTAASSMRQRRRRRSRSRKSCSRAAVASSSMHGRSSWLHRGAAGAAKAESEHNIDDDDEDGDEDEDLSCESPAASAVSSCEGNILRPDAAGYNQSEAVEGFFADHEQEPNAETRGYSTNNYCSAYVPLDWRPASHYEIPGGFDYFSF